MFTFANIIEIRVGDRGRSVTPKKQCSVVMPVAY